MIGFLRKSALVGLLSMFSLVSLFGVAETAFAKVDRPTISISERNTNSVVLSVKQTDLKRDKVTIRVRIENVATGEKFNQTFKVKLGDEGKKKVTVTNLKAGTEYKFQARIKERNKSTYSDLSRSKKVITRP